MPCVLGTNRSIATTWKSVFSKTSKFRDWFPGYFLHFHIYFSPAFPTTLVSDVLLVLAYSILVVFPLAFTQAQNTSWRHFALGIPSNLPPQKSGNRLSIFDNDLVHALQYDIPSIFLLTRKRMTSFQNPLCRKRSTNPSKLCWTI